MPAHTTADSPTNYSGLQHTETLKLLFVLYFSVLKNPRPTPLLPAALRGIARFAHLVNIDFFKDLLQVLKTLMTRDVDEDEDARAPGSSSAPAPRDVSNIATVQHQLLCVVTAFELLSGQGTYPPPGPSFLFIVAPSTARS